MNSGPVAIGIALPNNWGVADVADVVAVARRAEHLGFASVWVAEHRLNVGYLRERIGERPYYDPLALLAFLAGQTTTITLGTSVLVLPFHHPAELAKTAATIDRLSGGRLVLGIGSGGMRAEFDALGLAFDDRGPATDEALAALDAAWSGAGHDGPRWRFPTGSVTPRPQHGSIPLRSGGNSAAARRRAVGRCDGWQPTGLDPATYALAVAQIRAAAWSAGRDADALVMSVRLNLATPGAAFHGELERRAVVPVDALGAVVAGYVTAGATEVVLAVNSADLGVQARSLDLIAAAVSQFTV